MTQRRKKQPNWLRSPDGAIRTSVEHVNEADTAARISRNTAILDAVGTLEFYGVSADALLSVYEWLSFHKISTQEVSK